VEQMKRLRRVSRLRHGDTCVYANVVTAGPASGLPNGIFSNQKPNLGKFWRDSL
jgi:hypothetical protein